MKYAMTLTALTLTLALTGTVSAGNPALPNCPVMGEPIDFSVTTDTADGPLYFCCKMCIKKLKDDPAKYADGVAKQRKILAALPKVQVTCPVTGEPVDGKSFVEIKGKKILTCCKMCNAKLEANPDKYKSAIAASYTYQAKCPVMGGEIDPSVSTTLKSGEKVYFCCKRCIAPFNSDPAKYAPNLSAQGYGALAKHAQSGSAG